MGYGKFIKVSDQILCYMYIILLHRVKIGLCTMNNSAYWNNDCGPLTSTPGQFLGRRGESLMDVLKYKVFSCQNFPRHAFLHYHILYLVTKIISL